MKVHKITTNLHGDLAQVCFDNNTLFTCTSEELAAIKEHFRAEERERCAAAKEREAKIQKLVEFAGTRSMREHLLALPP